MNPESNHSNQSEEISVQEKVQEHHVVPDSNTENKIAELNENISSQTASAQETEDRIASLRAELGATGDIEIPSVEIAKQNIEKLTNEKQALEGTVSRESFAQNNILNPQVLFKLAELESIDENGQSNSDKYQSFLDFQRKAGDMSVESNQKRLQEIIEMGDEPQDYDYTDTSIYGIGGMNRYSASENGTIRLLRGNGISSGSESYKDALESKAQELGFIVG